MPAPAQRDLHRAAKNASRPLHRGQEAIGLPRFHSCFSLKRPVTVPNRGASASPSLPGARSPASPQGGLQSVTAPLCPVLAGYSSRSSRDEVFAPVSYHGWDTLSRERRGQMAPPWGSAPLTGSEKSRPPGLPAGPGASCWAGSRGHRTGPPGGRGSAWSPPLG